MQAIAVAGLLAADGQAGAGARDTARAAGAGFRCLGRRGLGLGQDREQELPLGLGVVGARFLEGCADDLAEARL